LRVTAPNAQARALVGGPADAVQEAAGNTVELAWVDQGFTGDEPSKEAGARWIELVVVRLPEAKQGLVLLPRRWVVEQSFAWVTRFRRLANDDERLPETVAGLHFLALTCLMLQQRLLPDSASP
ncbi:MAG TPA: transposase, partial [Thermomicrobiales bacterium]|nr:transposase [Thermomicrobiales bacterium]